MIQLPDDVISKGYKQISAFQFSQVFYSPSNNFTGIDTDFVKAKLGYKYIQIDEFKRLEVK